MSKDWYQDVLEFHKKFGCHIGEIPKEPNIDVRELRKSVIYEEYEELKWGIANGDLVQIADACADLIYVIVGTAISYGIDLRSIWDLVQDSNMAKVGGGERKDGKILKPKGWKHPNIEAEIERQKRSLTITD